MKMMKMTILAAAMSVVAAPAFASPGNTASFTFNLPSTAVASQSPPYPAVATITLTEVASGVDFVLTPNWSDSTTGFSAQSHIEHLEFVYKGVAFSDFTTTGSLTNPVAEVSYGDKNMDSGYKSNGQSISVDWSTQNNSNRFDKDFSSSSWSVNGTHLTDFTGTQATHNSHPSPIFGIISVDSYSLHGHETPTPSNWVSAVPEPQTYAMLLAGLGLMGFMAHRRKTS